MAGMGGADALNSIDARVSIGSCVERIGVTQFVLMIRLIQSFAGVRLPSRRTVARGSTTHGCGAAAEPVWGRLAVKRAHLNRLLHHQHMPKPIRADPPFSLLKITFRCLTTGAHFKEPEL